METIGDQLEPIMTRLHATFADKNAAREKALSTSGLPKPLVGMRHTPSVFCNAISRR